MTGSRHLEEHAMKTKNTLSFATLPKEYGALVALFPPRPIRDRIAYDSTVEVVDAMARHALNKDQEDYLEILSRTIEVFDAGMSSHSALASQPRNPGRLTSVRSFRCDWASSRNPGAQCSRAAWTRFSLK